MRLKKPPRLDPQDAAWFQLTNALGKGMTWVQRSKNSRAHTSYLRAGWSCGMPAVSSLEERISGIEPIFVTRYDHLQSKHPISSIHR